MVRDIEETSSFLSSTFGLGAWQKFDFTFKKDDFIIGRPCRIKLYGAALGQTVMELIEPVEGDSIWADFVGVTGGGLHHVAFSVRDWQDRVSDLQKRGGKMVVGGVNAAMHWGYFSTPIGIIVEFEEKVPELLPLLTFADADTTSQPDLYHINAIVEDMDKAIDFLSATFGLGPWQIREKTMDEYHKGTPANELDNTRVALTKLSPITLELGALAKGKSLWSQFIGSKGPGINHLAFGVPDWEETTSRLQKLGGKMMVGGVNAEKHWGYFSTPTGIIVKLSEKT